MTEIRVANKLAFSFGGIPERSKGADCKSVGSAFEGSNPSPSTIYSGVEQLVARRAHNPKVVGSNPAPATKYKNPLQSQGILLYAVFIVAWID